MKYMKYFIRLCRLCHKDYDVNLDYGAYNGLFMEMTYHSGCDVIFIWLTAIGFGYNV